MTKTITKSYVCIEIDEKEYNTGKVIHPRPMFQKNDSMIALC